MSYVPIAVRGLDDEIWDDRGGSLHLVVPPREALKIVERRRQTGTRHDDDAHTVLVAEQMLEQERHGRR